MNTAAYITLLLLFNVGSFHPISQAVKATSELESKQQDGTVRAGECDHDDDGTACPSHITDDAAADGSVPDSAVCFAQNYRCVSASSSSSSIFYYGGSAQAYKPNAPLKTEICSFEDIRNHGRHKVARWPLYRSSSSSAPRLRIKGRIMSCKGGTEGIGCCCSALSEDVTVEAWQTRPDGTYSSIRQGVDVGSCRSTVPLINNSTEGSSIFEVTTWMPGSTGTLNGLGPHGIDFPPYGPPVFHVLIAVGGHEVLLAQLEVMSERDGKERNFAGPDLRGPAMVGAGSKSRTKRGVEAGMIPYEVTSRIEKKGTGVDDGNNNVEIEMEVTFYLRMSTTATVGRTAALEEEKAKALCPSNLYGLPHSFFVQPMSVCAPSLLEFFPL